MDDRTIRCLDNLQARITTLEAAVDTLVDRDRVQRHIMREVIRVDQQIIGYLQTYTPVLIKLSKHLEN